MLTNVCATCGAPFNVFPCEATAKYCSLKCYANSEMHGRTMLPVACASCGDLLPLPRRNQKKFCESCRGRIKIESAKIRSQQWYFAHRDLVKARTDKWKTANPDKVSDSSHRRYERQRDRILAVCRAWGEKNPDKRRDHRETRRARERNAFVEQVDRVVVWFEHRGLCGICGRGVSLQLMELDHVIPLSKGGLHEYRNCQPSHMTCNRQKFSDVRRNTAIQRVLPM